MDNRNVLKEWMPVIVLMVAILVSTWGSHSSLSARIDHLSERINILSERVARLEGFFGVYYTDDGRDSRRN